MLKTYDRSQLLTNDLLRKCIQPILSKKSETSFFDLKHLINVYFKYKYFDSYHLLNYFEQQYTLLSRSVNEETLINIWQFLPEAVNSGRLPPNFIDQLVRSLRYLKSKRRLSSDGWKTISLSFPKFQNPDLKR